MSGYLKVVPRRGVDYRSQAAVLAAWNGNADFRVDDDSSPWDGKPISKSGASRHAAGTKIEVRYDRQRKVLMIKNPGPS